MRGRESRSGFHVPALSGPGAHLVLRGGGYFRQAERAYRAGEVIRRAWPAQCSASKRVPVLDRSLFRSAHAAVRESSPKPWWPKGIP
jgi:hypothetical protein